MSPPRGRRRLVLALPAVAYAAVILYVSSRSGADLPSTGVWGGDKLLHVAEYFAYGLLLCLPVLDLGWRGRVLALAVGIAYAGFDEWFQSTIPGRFGDAGDFAFDVLGLASAVAVVTAALRRTDVRAS